MTYHFSNASLVQLHTCDVHLQEVIFAALKLTPMDFKILQGHRSVKEQQALFNAVPKRTHIDGITKLSKHNHTPSRAVDLAPYPIDWNDMERFRFLGGFILGVAACHGIRLRWGGDWDSDGSFKDQNFNDLPHFELTEDAGALADSAEPVHV